MQEPSFLVHWSPAILNLLIIFGEENKALLHSLQSMIFQAVTVKRIYCFHNNSFSYIPPFLYDNNPKAAEALLQQKKKFSNYL